MPSFLTKWRGDGAGLPPRPNTKNVLLAWCGGVLAIGALGALASLGAATLILGSFGASCVLVFGYPDVPFAQPRNVVVGHCLSSAIGLAFLAAFGPTWWGMALAAGTACALMMATRTVHPPAGSNPVIVFLGHPGWGFLFFPTLAGAVLIVLIALVYNNATREARYPKYW
jgi:CBS-domain-containing membrane protein